MQFYKIHELIFIIDYRPSKHIHESVGNGCRIACATTGYGHLKNEPTNIPRNHDRVF